MRKFYVHKHSRLLIKLLFFAAFCIFPSLSYAQQNVVKGKVIDNSDGSEVIGATVKVVGSPTAAVTDIKGEFSITLKTPTAILSVSFIGYQSASVTAKAGDNLTIKLSAASNSLNEVIVVGYGTQKKSDVTGSVAGINSEQLNRNRSTDIFEAMQGKIPGVQITSQSGELGSSYSIKVRGAVSINGSSSPLFVIDGIPIDVNTNEVAGSSLATSSSPNPLASINPQDIESIEVLKDASATAIYGSRGANGVVLVTTKSGKEGKTSVDYDGYARFNSLAKRITVLNANEYLANRVVVFGPTDALVMQMDPNGDGIVDVPTHDWQNEVYQHSVSQNHTITATGGTKTTQFSGSLGFLNDNGLVITNYNNKYSARLRLDQAVNDNLKVGLNVNLSASLINGATNSGGAFQGVSRAALFSRPVDLYTPGDASDGFDTYVSPVTNITNSFLNSNTTRSLLSAYAKYKINKDFTFNVVMGGGLSDSKGQEFYNSQTTGGVKTNGSAAVQNIHTYNWTNTNQITYNRAFARSSSLNIIGVFELSSYNFESTGQTSQNFPYQGTGVYDVSKALSISGIATNRYMNNRVSFVSRINYVLFDKYLFTASLRADASDKFDASHRQAYFPSGAFAWKISNENFMKKFTAISNLKFRLSYGITGNEKISPYSYLPLLENSYYASNGTAQLGLSPANPGNVDLVWEQNTSYNGGLDLSLFNGRIEFTGDYYVKQVKNMLIKAQLPTQGGYYSQFENLGRVDNRGVELSVTTHNIQKKNFSWDTDFNVTFDESEVKSLGNSTNLPITLGGDISALGQIIVGQQYGSGYGYVGDGIYQLSDFTLVGTTYVLNSGVPSFNGATVQPGSYKFKDLSGPNGVPDGIIDSYDQQVISHSLPKFTGGFNNSIHFSNFDFTFFLQGVYGRQIINEIKLDETGYKPNKNILTDFYYNRWTPTNPTNTYGTYSNLNATALYNNTNYVEDGSYLRLKSITLAYNLPAKILQRVKGVAKVRIYVTGNDLLTWTKYTGYDPEVANKNDQLTGVDELAYPRSRNFLIGLSAKF